MIVIPTSVRTGFMWKKEKLKGKSFGRKCLLSFFQKKESGGITLSKNNAKSGQRWSIISFVKQ